jgi:hypothetical protein
MRTIKQLLEVMLEHQELFRSGLCHWNSLLYNNDIITFSEKQNLSEYIRGNKASKYSSWSAFREQSKDFGFYWEIGYIKPRIKWIKKHIKKNS